MTTFTGTADDDSFTGTSDGDDFHLEQGGHDTAFGGAGIDVFYMGAAFDRIDQIDGGSDEDYLLLSGDYRKGVAFTATTMTAIEVVQLDPGFKYRLTGLTDANVGAALTIDGGGLGHKDKMTIDASGVVDGALVVIGGAGKNLITTGGGDDTISALDGANRINAGRGDDSVSVLDGDNSISGAGGDDIITVGDGDNTIDGGNGADRITFGAGANHVTSGAGDDSFYGPVTAGDILDAGTGVDTLFSQGAAVPLGAENAAGFERIVYGGDAVLVLEDSFNSGGLTVRSADETVGSLQFDGSQETDARFDVDGTHQADVITGGALGDHLAGGAGADLISGGDGDDFLLGGQEADTLYGGDGDDELSAGSAKHNSSTGDLLNGGNGNDHLLSSGAGNTLVGSRGDDVLISANGWTRMNGGPGRDSYNGNLAIGHDTFVFSDAGDSTADRPDLIHGLNSNSTIDLTAIDADITTPGDQAFHLVSSLGGHAGELALVYDSLRDTTSIMGDIDGDGTADFVVAIEGDATGFTGFAL